MEKVSWANTDNFDEAEFVIVGIPDESQSHAQRKGTEEAPFKIRQISNQRDSYERNKKIILGRPFRGIEKKFMTLETSTENKLKLFIVKYLDLLKYQFLLVVITRSLVKLLTL